ncbi:hypothetical protein H0H93_015487 [Arthromyces matolae]|nr:hypothetical protein H0H93_015487 [Arthromyces matolae]
MRFGSLLTKFKPKISTTSVQPNQNSPARSSFAALKRLLPNKKNVTSSVPPSSRPATSSHTPPSRPPPSMSTPPTQTKPNALKFSEGAFGENFEALHLPETCRADKMNQEKFIQLLVLFDLPISMPVALLLLLAPTRTSETRLVRENVTLISSDFPDSPPHKFWVFSTTWDAGFAVVDLPLGSTRSEPLLAETLTRDPQARDEGSPASLKTPLGSPTGDGFPNWRRFTLDFTSHDGNSISRRRDSDTIPHPFNFTPMNKTPPESQTEYG